MNSFVTLTDKLTARAKRAKPARGRGWTVMESFSIWHWIIFAIVIAMGASPILGIIRGVKNGGVVHAVASVFLPVYGLIYFFAARQPRK